MNKIKPMLPTLRERKRYLVYEVLSKSPSKKENEIVRNIRETLGVFDSAEAGIVPVEYNAKKQRGILRMAHTSLDKVRAGIAMLKFPNSIVHTVGVSGTLLKVRSRYMK